MIMLRYPNLELLEYKAREYSVKKFNSGEWTYNRKTTISFEVYAMFKQTWCNTARAFEDGECCSGQAFTDSYMTVFKAKVYQWEYKAEFEPYEKYFVFCDDRLAYVVDKMNDNFEDGIQRRLLEDRKGCRSLYYCDCKDWGKEH